MRAVYCVYYRLVLWQSSLEFYIKTWLCAALCSVDCVVLKDMQTSMHQIYALKYTSIPHI